MRQTVFEKCIQAVKLLRSIYPDYAIIIYDAWPQPVYNTHYLINLSQK
jgi:hypothetical protein